MLKAQPPKGHKLTTEDLDRSVTIMRNRVDKLGVSEPMITKQGTDQISIQLAGVHDVEPGGEDHRLDRAARAVRPRGRRSWRRRRRQRAGRVASLYELLSQVPPGLKVGDAERLRPLQAGQGCGRHREEPKTSTVYVRAAGPVPTLHRDPTTGNAGLLDPYRGHIPTGWKVLPVPHWTAAHQLLGEERHRLSGRSRGLPPPGLTDYYLFKNGPYKNDRYGPYPNMKGTD